MPGYNPWETETPTKGFERDYSGTIRSIEWQAGRFDRFQATLKVTLDEPEIRRDNGEMISEATEFYSLGSTSVWETRDGGDSYVGAKKEDQKVRNDTDWGRWLDRVKELYAGRMDELGDPRKHSTWVGKRFHFASTSFPVPAFTDRDGDKHEASAKLVTLPDRILDGSGAPEQAFDLAGLHLPPDVEQRLTEFANASTSKEEFQAAVMPVIKEFPASHQGQIIQALSDDGFRTALGESF